MTVNDTIRFLVASITPFLAGWLGLQYGLKQIKEGRRLSFIEKQLSEFYSPLLGLYKEIQAKSELRAKLENKGKRMSIWKKRVAGGRQPSLEPIIKDTEYHNRQLVDDVLPMFREMLLIFRKGYWLAEPETRKFYGDLVEYVEIWNRGWGGSGAPDALREIGYSEESLTAFYEDLEKQTNALRGELAKKNHLLFQKNPTKAIVEMW